MASLKQYYSLTITALLLLALSLLSTVSPTKPIIYTTSKDQVACAMCDSCDNPCQPVYPPPPPPPEILCPPPPPPPSPPPPKPECPPPPAPPTCSDCTPCNDCSPPAIIGPYPHPSPQPGVIGGAVYSPPSAVYSPPYGVNPYFPYTPYKTPPSPSDQSAGFRVSSAVPLLGFWLAALCFFKRYG